MKTIKNAKQQIWKRVTEREAHSQVGFGGWEFCPKSEWKEKVRDLNKPKKVKDAEPA